MNRDQAQALIGSILELPREGELTVLLDSVERLGTRFNDCAISQNVLKRQSTLTLSARIENKRASVEINTLDDRDAIRAGVERAFATCRHMPDDEEVMPACGAVLEAREHAFSSASAALDIETIGAWVARACSQGAAAAR